MRKDKGPTSPKSQAKQNADQKLHMDWSTAVCSASAWVHGCAFSKDDRVSYLSSRFKQFLAFIKGLFLSVLEEAFRSVLKRAN